MKSCLIVDDSQVVRKVLRRIIEDMQFTCDESDNGQEAYEFCRTHMPDVVIVDCMMPFMGGVEFVQKLRRAPNGKHPAIIVCSSDNEEKTIRAIVAAGADEYIMKPFDREIVRSKFTILGLNDTGENEAAV